MKKQISRLLLASTLLLCATTNTKTDTDNLGKGLLIAAGALGCLGGAVMLSNWMFSESDQQLLDRAEKTCHEIYNEFEGLIQRFNELHGLRRSVKYSSGQQAIYNYSENILYEVATYVWHQDKKQSFVRSQAASHVQTLHKLKNKLSQRVQKLQYESYSPESRQLVQSMKTFIQYIDTFLPHLELLSKYLQQHRSYFDLYDCDNVVRNYYRPILDIIDQHRYDAYLCADQVKRYILTSHYGRYPLSKYLTTLYSYIADLQRATRNTDARYAQRIAWAHQLEESLQYIKSVIISDPIYHQEQRDMEWDRIERQRIKALQERAQLERERARWERECLRREQERHNIYVTYGAPTAFNVSLNFEL